MRNRACRFGAHYLLVRIIICKSGRNVRDKGAKIYSTSREYKIWFTPFHYIIFPCACIFFACFCRIFGGVVVAGSTNVLSVRFGWVRFVSFRVSNFSNAIYCCLVDEILMGVILESFQDRLLESDIRISRRSLLSDSRSFDLFFFEIKLWFY